MEPLSEHFERSELNSLPDRPHRVKVKLEIMQRIKRRGGHLAGHDRGAADRLVKTCGRCSTRTPGRRPIVLRLRRVLDVDAAAAREELAVARVAGGHDAVEHVDAPRDAFDEVHRRARLPSGTAAARPGARRDALRRCRTSPRSVRRRSARRSRTPSNPIATVPRASRAQVRVMLPCTIPNCAWPGLVTVTSRSAPARIAEEPIAARAAPTAAVALASRLRRPRASPDSARHSSSTIAMSEPRRAWMSTARSGVRRCALPSRCDRNATPSSVTVRRAREAEDLIAAAVGQDRLRPAHEPVQAATPRDQRIAGPQVAGGRCCRG